MTEKVTKIVSELLPGDSIIELIEQASLLTRVAKREEEFNGARETVVTIPDVDTEILSTNGKTVDVISYGPGFPGEINGVSIGIPGDEVEKILGPPDRLWPMPHPNYVLLYDVPTFFRVELDRKTEKVILMLR